MEAPGKNDLARSPNRSRDSRKISNAQYKYQSPSLKVHFQDTLYINTHGQFNIMSIPTTTMHFFIVLAAIAAAASASPLEKRCSSVYDPAYNHNMRPPAPCWLTFDSSCYSFIAPNTELYIDKKHGLVLVFGMSRYCSADIAEELAREKDGRKIYGWTEQHGKLTDLGGGQLVISNMTADAVEFYEKLTPYETRLKHKDA